MRRLDDKKKLVVTEVKAAKGSPTAKSGQSAKSPNGSDCSSSSNGSKNGDESIDIRKKIRKELERRQQNELGGQFDKNHSRPLSPKKVLRSSKTTAATTTASADLDISISVSNRSKLETSYSTQIESNERNQTEMNCAQSKSNSETQTVELSVDKLNSDNENAKNILNLRAQVDSLENLLRESAQYITQLSEQVSVENPHLLCTIQYSQFSP